MASQHPKVVVVMPAYNAAKTLRMTYADLPHDMVDLVILVDDGSSDETARIARELAWSCSSTTATTATAPTRRPATAKRSRAGADIVVMVHPDYQYDPTLLPQIIRPIVGRRGRRGARLAPDGRQPHDAGHAVVEV